MSDAVQHNGIGPDSRFCRDCRWVLPGPGAARCRNPAAADVTALLVTGDLTNPAHYRLCVHERGGGQPCGLEGRLWEARSLEQRHGVDAPAFPLGRLVISANITALFMISFSLLTTAAFARWGHVVVGAGPLFVFGILGLSVSVLGTFAMDAFAMDAERADARRADARRVRARLPRP